MNSTEKNTKSFWKTKLFYAATAEVLTISIIYILFGVITKNRMFAIGMAGCFSIMSIYVFGPIIGWFQVVIVRAASFVSIVEGIIHGNLGISHVWIRILILVVGISIPIFLTAYLWAKKENDLDTKFFTDDYCEKQKISQTKAVGLIISVIAILNSLFYFLKF